MDGVNDYLPVLVMAGLGVIFAGSALGASWLMGEVGHDNPVKNTPYECGLPIESHAHERFSVKFYVVAMLFILFDVEIVFMYPWAVSFGRSDADIAQPAGVLLASAGAFVGILFFGWVYVVKKGVLEWHNES